MKTELGKPDRKIDCYYIGKNHHILEAVVFGKNNKLENLLGSHKPKPHTHTHIYTCRFEKRSGSRNRM